MWVPAWACAHVPVTTHQLYTSQKHVELVCGFYGIKHPKCKTALEKDDELYKNFILQFDNNRYERHDDDDGTSIQTGKEMGTLRVGDTIHNRNNSTHSGVENEKK